MDDYPEHDKVAKAREAGSEEVARFYDWLMKQGLILCTYATDPDWNDEVLIPSSTTKRVLINDFYGIDPWKLELEKRQILDGLTALNH